MAKTKLFITGDVHLNEWDEFSTILPSGINSRLQVGLDAIDQIATAAKGHVLVIAGDLFHTREEISVQVLYRAGEAIRRAASVCKEVLILVGNHDQHLKDGRVHSLGTFQSDNVRVIDKPELIDIDGFGRVVFMPYTHDYEEFGREYKKLAEVPFKSGLSILHADITGFEMNSGFMSTKGITPEFALEVGGPMKLISLCISGHYHKPQKFGDLDVYYVGSPYQMDRSEAGHEKRYLVVSPDLSVESVPIVGLPVFRKVTLKEARDLKKTSDFVDVACNEDEVRDGWSEPLSTNFNIVLERNSKNESDFTSVELGSACQKYLKDIHREDLIETAMERLSRNS
jgi:DNA repair exonuclease SbcCD nuclease subunit